MCMASRKRNPFFRRPHVLTRWSLAELENPHWPAPLYSVRASMEKAVCLTECLWCFLTTPPNPPPTHLVRLTAHPSCILNFQALSSIPIPRVSLSVSLFLSGPDPISSDGHTLVTSARRPSNNPHRPLASSDSHLRRRHNQSSYWGHGEIKKRKRDASVCLCFYLSTCLFFAFYPPSQSFNGIWFKCQL